MCSTYGDQGNYLHSNNYHVNLEFLFYILSGFASLVLMTYLGMNYHINYMPMFSNNSHPHISLLMLKNLPYHYPVSLKFKMEQAVLFSISQVIIFT